MSRELRELLGKAEAARTAQFKTDAVANVTQRIMDADNPKKIIYNVQFIAKILNGQFLHQAEPGDDKSKATTVKGWNDQYAFVITRKPGEPNWALLNVDRVTEDGSASAKKQADTEKILVEDSTNPWLFGATNFDGVPVSVDQIESLTNFTLISVNSTTHTIEFACTEHPEQTTPTYYKVTLAPDKLYIPHSIESVNESLKDNFRRENKTSREIEILGKSIKAIYRGQTKTVFGKNVESTVGDYSVQIDYDGTLRDEDFRLSAFGLPEPAGVAWSRPTPLWVWLVGAAGVCGVAAAVFGYLRRRAGRSGTPG